ncbi:MAG: hypothetical protein ABI488_24795 [Polyangiaceae bacterium]
MKTLALLLTLGFGSVASAAAHAEPAQLPQLPSFNVAALAASDTQLFVGGFDAGLYVVERDGTARHLDDPALNPQISLPAWRGGYWIGSRHGLEWAQLQ